MTSDIPFVVWQQHRLHISVMQPTALQYVVTQLAEVEKYTTKSMAFMLHA